MFERESAPPGYRRTMSGQLKPKPKRKSRRHPKAQRFQKGVWHPELVGEVPYYPKTQEKFDALVEKARALSARMRAEGKWDHRGVPTGMGRRKAEVIAIRAQADIEAREIVKAMAEQGLIDDEAIGNEALMAAVSVIRAKTPDGVHLTPLRERLTAMRLVMEFTKSKPVNKTEVKLETAEDFLAALATKK